MRGTKCAWMVPAFSSGEAKGNSWCHPTSTHHWTPGSYGCSDSWVTLPAGCTNSCQHLSALKPVQRDRGCSRLCFKALPCLDDIIPGAELLKVNGPQRQQEPGEGLLPGVHISAQRPPLMLEYARNLWKLGTLTEKYRCQWITKWLALCKPKYILKISGKMEEGIMLQSQHYHPGFRQTPHSLVACWKTLWLMVSMWDHFPRV